MYSFPSKDTAVDEFSLCVAIVWMVELQSSIMDVFFWYKSGEVHAKYVQPLGSWQGATGTVSDSVGASDLIRNVWMPLMVRVPMSMSYWDEL